MTTAKPIEVREFCDSLGLTVLSLHAPFLGFSGSVEEQRRQWADGIKATAEWAASLGAGAVVVHPLTFGPIEAAAQLEMEVNASLEVLRPALESLQGYGIRLNLENTHGRRGHRWGRRVAELVRAVDQLDKNHVGICVDTGHSAYNEISPSDDLRTAGPHLASLHVNDNFWGKGTDAHLPPGKGDIDWAGFRETLIEVGYNGPLVLELAGGENAAETLRLGKAAALQQLGF
jgi:sugar phosphate isomerase/epimerase